MSKKKPGRKPKDSQSLNIRLASAVQAALDHYLNTTVPPPSKTGTVEAALIEFLRSKGCWPVPAGPGPSQDNVAHQ